MGGAWGAELCPPWWSWGWAIVCCRGRDRKFLGHLGAPTSPLGAETGSTSLTARGSLLLCRREGGAVPSGQGCGESAQETQGHREPRYLGGGGDDTTTTHAHRDTHAHRTQASGISVHMEHRCSGHQNSHVHACTNTETQASRTQIHTQRTRTSGTPVHPHTGPRCPGHPPPPHAQNLGIRDTHTCARTNACTHPFSPTHREPRCPSPHTRICGT